MREQRQKQKALKQAKAAETEPHKADAEQTNDAVAHSFANPQNILWVILAGGMALTVLGAQFLPGVVANDSITSVYSAMLWVGIFGATLARYVGKNGWLGFAIGSGIGVILNIAAGLV